MISIDKLKVIAKAKFSDKKKLGDWYKTRLEICKDCPLNSTNKEHLSVRDRAVVLANLGKPSCLACGCEIDAKASVRTEQCGLVKLKQEPLWESLPEIVESNFKELTINNLSSDKIYLKPTAKGLEINYGTVPNGFDSLSKFSIKSNIAPITTIKVIPGCGCTSTTNSLENGEAVIGVAYDTVGRQGAVQKDINIYYTAGKVKKVLLCTLLINVEKKN